MHYVVLKGGRTIEVDTRRVSFSASATACPTVLFAGELVAKCPRGAVWRKPASYLFHLVVDGSGTVLLPDGRQEAVSAGDWFFCFPDQTLRYEQDPADPWLYRWVAFQGGGAEAILARAGIDAKTGVRRLPPDEVTASILRTLVDLLGRRDLMVDLEANECLLRLLRRLIETNPDPGTVASPTARGAEAYVENACQFMVNHFAEGIGVGDVVRYIGYDRCYFSKLFSQITGVTLQQYLASLRQRKAEELIAGTDLTVESVASAVGYEDAKTFSRFFKNQSGVSPRAWRRNRQDNSIPSSSAMARSVAGERPAVVR